MLEIFLRLQSEIGSGATWAGVILGAVVAAFVVYVGVIITAMLIVKDRDKLRLLYRVFRDLVELFRFRGRR
jgi:hypothetical protein